MESVNLFDDDVDQQEVRFSGPRTPPPVQFSNPENSRRSTQPSVSVEQAAKPSFTVTVGDPHKVGDLTSSHTVYQVRTKVWMKSVPVGSFCAKFVMIYYATDHLEGIP